MSSKIAVVWHFLSKKF